MADKTSLEIAWEEFKPEIEQGMVDSYYWDFVEQAFDHAYEQGYIFGKQFALQNIAYELGLGELTNSKLVEAGKAVAPRQMEYRHVVFNASLHQDHGLDFYLNREAEKGWRVIQVIPPPRHPTIKSFTWEFLMERIKPDNQHKPPCPREHDGYGSCGRADCLYCSRVVL